MISSCSGIGGYVYSSTDGGITWAHSYTATTAHVVAVDIFNPTLAVILFSTSGDLITNDLVTWDELSLPWGRSTAFSFVNATTWLVCSSIGELWFTENAGKEWTHHFLSLGSPLSDVAYVSEWDAGVSVGTSAGVHGSLAFSLDQGRSWNASTLDNAPPFLRVVACAPYPLPPSSPSPMSSLGPTTLPPVVPSLPPTQGPGDSLNIPLITVLGGAGCAAALAVILVGVLVYRRYSARRLYQYRRINDDTGRE
jgi:hypothetical protein